MAELVAELARRLVDEPDAVRVEEIEEYDGTLVLRLAVADREAFVARYESRLHEAYGTVQKEYVDVPADLLEATDSLAPWFAASVTYVGGLRPKPTKRSTG